MLQILIADDHALLRKGLRDLLETRLGWRVCAEARDGREAVQLAERLRPNVAVVDLTMPEIDGIEATRQIHAVSPGTKVLILTATRSEEAEAATTSAGAAGFLLKASPETHVVSAIEALAKRDLAPPREARKPDGGCRNGCRIQVQDREARLTVRELEIAQLLADGKTNWCIATILGISARTVETHRANIMEKLGLESVVELVHYAVRNRIVEP